MVWRNKTFPENPISKGMAFQAEIRACHKCPYYKMPKEDADTEEKYRSRLFYLELDEFSESDAITVDSSFKHLFVGYWLTINGRAFHGILNHLPYWSVDWMLVEGDVDLFQVR